MEQRLKEILKTIGEPYIASEVQKSISNWKKIDFVIIRDISGTCIVVCNIEHFNTYDSFASDRIMIIPSQTLNNKEYQKLRNSAFKIVRTLDKKGICNVKFVINPITSEYIVVDIIDEENAISDFVVKAIDYPVYDVIERIKNEKELDVKSYIEPELDYVAVRFQALDGIYEGVGKDQRLEAALLKAIHIADEKMDSLILPELKEINNKDEIFEKLSIGDSKRIFIIAEALRRGISIDEVCRATGVDKYFIGVIQNIVDLEQELKVNSLNPELLLKAKNAGFTDRLISELNLKSEDEIKKMSEKLKK